MDEIKEKKSRQVLQIVVKVIVLAFFVSFVFRIKNIHQAIIWVFAVLFYVLFFFGKRAKAFFEQPWRFRTLEDFLWAITAILGVAALIIRAFF